MKQAAIVLLILLTVFSTQAEDSNSTAEETATQAIETVLHTFARGESEQSVEVLGTVLNPEFAMTAVMGGKVINFSREDFLAGIAAKKFGGNHNPLAIDHIAIDGKTAAVEMRLEGPKVRFHHFATLANVEEKWSIVHSLVTMEVR